MMMGKRIVEQEQQGKERADYGAQLLESLSKELTAAFGKSFSEIVSRYNYQKIQLWDYIHSYIRNIIKRALQVVLIGFSKWTI